MIQSRPIGDSFRARIPDFALQGANPESLSHGFLSLVLF
jgi:hypothetical protein